MEEVIEYLKKVSPEDAKKAIKSYSVFDRFQGLVPPPSQDLRNCVVAQLFSVGFFLSQANLRPMDSPPE
jgi:hypothetical protein